MITVIIQALTPIVLLAALGFFLAKKTQYLESPQLSNLVSNIGVPALLLHSVMTMEMELKGMISIVLATVAVLIAMVFVSFIFLKCMKLHARFYLSPLVNPNAGNLGIPVAYALFGEQGLAVAVVVSSVVQVSHFTLGVGLMSGNYQPKQLLKNGPVIALLVGAGFMLLNLRVPTPLLNTLELLSSITLPIMLMLLGRSLAELSFKEQGRIQRVTLLALFRPLVGASMAAIIVPWFGFSSLQEATMVMLHGMSVAVISYMLATKFEGPKDDIALMIMLSLPVSLCVAGSVWWFY